MTALVALTITLAVLAALPFPLAGLPRLRFTLGLLGGLGLAAEAIMIGLFLIWLAVLAYENGTRSSHGPLVSGSALAILALPPILIIGGVLGFVFLVRLQRRATRRSIAAL